MQRVNVCEQDGCNWVVDEQQTDDGVVVFTHCSVCGEPWRE